MDERTKKALERTHENAVRHLEDINDMIDGDGGRIKSHKALDGLKDAVKIVCRIDAAFSDASGIQRIR